MNNIRYEFVFIVFFLVGCSDPEISPSATIGPSATIELEYTEFGVTSFGSRYVMMELRHINGDPIYNAGCDVYALDGVSILDTGFVYFADGATIKAGQNTSDKAIFFDLVSTDAYTVDSECTWLY